MLLRRWDDLPEFMQTEEVKPYYDVLDKKRGQLILKRCFDITLSLILIALLSPVMLFFAIWIKLDSKGSTFYRQERVTQYGKIFRIYKLRTMTQNADKTGSSITVKADIRITNVGSRIRKFRVDEIPQLFNVVKGEMTFVGTRPEVKKYVDAYTDEMYATLLLPAGITSKASIDFKDEDELIEKSVTDIKNVDVIYMDNVLPKKMKINLETIKVYNFVNDLKAMINTILKV